MDAHRLILAFSGIIALSFVANLIAKRTNVPAVLMLMLLGFIIAQFTNIDQATLLPYLEVLGTIGVILIVLEASLDLHLEETKMSLIGRATLMALFGLLACTGLIAGVLRLALGMDWTLSMIYATPMAVLSSAIVIPSVGSLKADSKEFLIFESSLSDILGIIQFYALLDFYRAGATPDVIGLVSGKILLTMILSVVLSYLMILAFQSLKGGSVRLFLLIAILMGMYSAGKLLHLSPLILVMVFGLALNNKQVFFQGKMNQLVNDTQFDNILKDLRFITLESAFVVRTLFFVAFGMSIMLAGLFHLKVIGTTILILLIMYGVRYVGLLMTNRSQLEPAIYIAPRGLITVLLFYAIPAEIATEQFPPGIILLSILGSSLVMTYGLIREQRQAQRARAAKKAEAARRRAANAAASESNGAPTGEPVPAE
mgnify:CR=1 FL=1